MKRGLNESLAGRFELIRVTHWSFGEMREAFGWGWARYLFFGGYPGAAKLAEDVERWRRYILDSLVETTLSRDILLLTRVDKPALLRQLFRLACDYSGQILSYTKMLGQLQDAGNTTTLARYLELLSGAGMVTGLPKFSASRARQRGSSPKLLAMNTALMTAAGGVSFPAVKQEPEFWGRLVESAVGAHLVNRLQAPRWTPSTGGSAIGRSTSSFAGASGWWQSRSQADAGRTRSQAWRRSQKEFRPKRCLLVGGQGIPLNEFLTSPAEAWMR